MSRMSSKFILLFMFVVCWSRGYGYFFRRRDSTSSPSLDNVRGSHHKNTWVRSPPHPPPPPVLPYQFELLPPLEAVPLPVAIQVPPQILPLAMYPAIHAPFQSFKAGHPQVQVVPFTTPSPPPPPPPPQNIPFVKISHAEPPVPVPIPPQSVAAVRFIPCLCGTTGRDKYPKSAFVAPTSFVNSAQSMHPIQLLPCYCPMVRELDPRFDDTTVQSTVSEANSANYRSTTEAAKV